MRLIDAGWQVGAGCWKGLQSAAQGLSTGQPEWPQHLAWFPPEQVNQGSKEEAARPFVTQARSRTHIHSIPWVTRASLLHWERVGIPGGWDFRGSS